MERPMIRRNLEILACESTPLGLLVLHRRRLVSRPDVVVTEVTLDHEFLMSSYITESERVLATRALALHGGEGLDVLVGGLGLGYTAHAALTSGRAARVEVVEYLPEVIGWLEAGLVPLSDSLTGDGRLSVTEGDVYAHLAAPPARTWDAILIDVDHSPEDQLGGARRDFYTEAGLSLARRHLAPRGVLGIWSYAEHSPFADALRRVFPEVVVEGVTVHNDLVDEEQTDWLFFAR